LVTRDLLFIPIPVPPYSGNFNPTSYSFFILSITTKSAVGISAFLTIVFAIASFRGVVSTKEDENVQSILYASRIEGTCDSREEP